MQNFENAGRMHEKLKNIKICTLVYFGTSPDFWPNLQNRFDLERTVQQWQKDKNNAKLFKELVGMRNVSAA